ncbi:MAG: hypothetical protein HY329_00150 [Chloroflexi bacterium]|nr:hypothetical protein [Chloroflexota bacterium]
MTTTTARRLSSPMPPATTESRSTESTIPFRWVSTVLLALFVAIVIAMMVVPERGERLHRGSLELLALEAAGRGLGFVQAQAAQSGAQVVVRSGGDSR